jgi:CheY-like chemotaxis protein
MRIGFGGIGKGYAADRAKRKMSMRCLRALYNICGRSYVAKLPLDDRTGEGKDNDIDYDCILLDITLPDGNGLAILRKVKAEGKIEGVIIIKVSFHAHPKV